MQRWHCKVWSPGFVGKLWHVGAAGSSATLQVRGVTSWKDDDGENSESKRSTGDYSMVSRVICLILILKILNRFPY